MRPALTLLPVLLLAAGVAVATEREERTKLRWHGGLPPVLVEDGEVVPEPDRPIGKPLLVYVPHDEPTKDQMRFQDVALQNETFLLATKFFRCVRVSLKRAEDHPLLRELKLRPPVVVLFDRKLTTHAIAGGRASGMKIYGAMVKIARLDYETDLAATVRAARNHLANFDQIDAARDALAVKAERLASARARGDRKAPLLEKQVNEEQARIDEMYDRAEARWQEIWKLEMKEE